MTRAVGEEEKEDDIHGPGSSEGDLEGNGATSMMMDHPPDWDLLMDDDAQFRFAMHHLSIVTKRPTRTGLCMSSLNCELLPRYRASSSQCTTVSSMAPNSRSRWSVTSRHTSRGCVSIIVDL